MQSLVGELSAPRSVVLDGALCGAAIGAAIQGAIVRAAGHSGRVVVSVVVVVGGGRLSILVRKADTEWAA